MKGSSRALMCAKQQKTEIKEVEAPAAHDV